jgi:DNA-binding CsgD family transcriptional regulator
MSLEHSESESNWRLITLRQAEVLDLLVESKNAREIAKELVISVHTAERHLQHIREVTGQHSQVGLALWWTEHTAEWHASASARTNMTENDSA